MGSPKKLIADQTLGKTEVLTSFSLTLHSAYLVEYFEIPTEEGEEGGSGLKNVSVTSAMPLNWQVTNTGDLLDSLPSLLGEGHTEFQPHIHKDKNVNFPSANP